MISIIELEHLWVILLLLVTELLLLIQVEQHFQEVACVLEGYVRRGGLQVTEYDTDKRGRM